MSQAGKIRRGGASIKCSALRRHRTVLIGDAAHAVTPASGLGVNSALEDVAMLHQVCALSCTAATNAAPLSVLPSWHVPAGVMLEALPSGFGLPHG